VAGALAARPGLGHHRALGFRLGPRDPRQAGHPLHDRLGGADLALPGVRGGRLLRAGSQPDPLPGHPTPPRPGPNHPRNPHRRPEHRSAPGGDRPRSCPAPLSRHPGGPGGREAARRWKPDRAARRGRRGLSGHARGHRRCPAEHWPLDLHLRQRPYRPAVRRRPRPGRGPRGRGAGADRRDRLDLFVSPDHPQPCPAAGPGDPVPTGQRAEPPQDHGGGRHRRLHRRPQYPRRLLAGSPAPASGPRHALPAPRPDRGPSPRGVQRRLGLRRRGDARRACLEARPHAGRPVAGPRHPLRPRRPRHRPDQARARRGRDRRPAVGADHDPLLPARRRRLPGPRRGRGPGRAGGHRAPRGEQPGPRGLGLDGPPLAGARPGLPRLDVAATVRAHQADGGGLGLGDVRQRQSRRSTASWPPGSIAGSPP